MAAPESDRTVFGQSVVVSSSVKPNMIDSWPTTSGTQLKVSSCPIERARQVDACQVALMVQCWPTWSWANVCPVSSDGGGVRVRCAQHPWIPCLIGGIYALQQQLHGSRHLLSLGARGSWIARPPFNGMCVSILHALCSLSLKSFFFFRCLAQGM